MAFRGDFVFNNSRLVEVPSNQEVRELAKLLPDSELEAIHKNMLEKYYATKGENLREMVSALSAEIFSRILDRNKTNL
jgi:hypothetical protein